MNISRIKPGKIVPLENMNALVFGMHWIDKEQQVPDIPTSDNFAPREILIWNIEVQLPEVLSWSMLDETWATDTHQPSFRYWQPIFAPEC